MNAILGQIILFAGNFTPVGWKPCDGLLMNIAENSALFSILGTIYGGDGRVTFALPDLRGRVPIGVGSSPAPHSGPPYQIGQRGGQERVTLQANQIPAHNHRVVATLSTTTQFACGSALGTSGDPHGKYLASNAAGNNTYASNLNNPVNLAGEAVIIEAEMRGDTQAAGGGQAHYNMAPFLAMNYIICVEGIYL